MRKIILDIDKMYSIPALHKYLHRALELPTYYGANLDALYDCLTDIAEPTELVVPNAIQNDDKLGWYGAQLVKCMQDAAAENDSLTVTLAK